MKRTPMKRSGFKRAPRREPIERAERVPAQAVATVKPIRRGVIAPVNGFTAAIPKTPRHKNAHLLEMARGRGCLMRVQGVCNYDSTTTVAAHSNWSRHGGKGGARKANDEFTVWSCSCCHDWLDKGPADAVLKEMTFMRAHLAQVLEWRAIAFDTTQPERDRRAAQWALDHLNATPIGAAA
ncbi:nuclease domain-containing protein [Curvibacter lanceolatus]|uniref:nuclease domain-containing protein n=1 Tax=Curvibacter lanceolatus TaxID=86182 RepID=UPI00036D6B57|nr:nuclease domain-containing protein [Curvibacter lanceolatus]